MTSTHPSHFNHLPAYGGDPILDLMDDFHADTRPQKVSVSVGVYFDESGQLPMLDSVRRAETALLQDLGPRPYLPIDGLPSRTCISRTKKTTTIIKNTARRAPSVESCVTVRLVVAVKTAAFFGTRMSATLPTVS